LGDRCEKRSISKRTRWLVAARTKPFSYAGSSLRVASRRTKSKDSENYYILRVCLRDQFLFQIRADTQGGLVQRLAEFTDIPLEEGRDLPGPSMIPCYVLMVFFMLSLGAFAVFGPQ
jgi:hypothetical protein